MACVTAFSERGYRVPVDRPAGRGRHCSGWSGSRCSWQTSVRAWEHNSEPPDCPLVWGVVAPCPSLFSVPSILNAVPRNNVIFVGEIALLGAFIITYGLGAEMLNFGALIAFMGINLAAF